MSLPRSTAIVLASLLLALSLIVSGALVGRGLEAARSSDRFVTVRGLSERIVDADLVIWPIVFSSGADDLEGLQTRIDAQAKVIEQFLAERQLTSDEWSVSPTRVTSNQGYGNNRPENRYSGEATIAVRSTQIATVRKAIQESGELVRRGVAMLHSYEHQTEFLFTALDSVKPEMIAEATLDARQAAQQFADDSGSSVGAIRRAQQGYFSITDRDAFSPQFKKVRVVTTVDYFLVGR